jgi:hypothetical protein
LYNHLVIYKNQEDVKAHKFLPTRKLGWLAGSLGQQALGKSSCMNPSYFGSEAACFLGSVGSDGKEFGLASEVGLDL